MDRPLVHATEIRVLPGEREAKQLLNEIRQRENCVSAAYRRLQPDEVRSQCLQAKDKETVDFLAKLTNLNVPVYLFEWDVIENCGDSIR
ncbi:MAG: hypothetical protein AAF974_09640 [Cyanobacteria bacterium P01_E01_bin.34]